MDRRTSGHYGWLPRILTGAAFALVMVVGAVAFLVLYSGLQNVGPRRTGAAAGTPTVVRATAVRTAVPAANATEVQATATPATTPTPATRYRIQAAQRINLRSQPSTSASVVTTLAPGAIVTIAGPDKQAEGKTWRNIKDQQGNTGWTWSDFVVPLGSN